ncbi:hypothetical protein P7C71_g6555, partial [Lecanoromycetidae sp. Uapishka_2]
MHPLITLEEHYQASPLADLPHNAVHYAGFPQHLKDKLRDLSSQRIADMDAGAVSLQVISHGPGIGNSSECREANQTLSAAVKRNPARFAGFATLPMGNPEAAAKELEHGVKELGFVGALVENHFQGRFYDDEAFWPVFEMAEQLDTVLYIHPTFPSGDRDPLYKGNYVSSVERSLGGAGFGWHMETGLHILRLFAAGVFDRFPKIKIVIGHMGELLPFQLERIAKFAGKGMFGERKKGFMDMWNSNIWITTAGMFSLNPLSCLLRNTKVERIMYSVDYPFSTNEEGLEFMEELRKSGMVTEEQLELIAYRNAENLLGVKANFLNAIANRARELEQDGTWNTINNRVHLLEEEEDTTDLIFIDAAETLLDETEEDIHLTIHIEQVNDATITDPDTTTPLTNIIEDRNSATPLNCTLLSEVHTMESEMADLIIELNCWIEEAERDGIDIEAIDSVLAEVDRQILIRRRDSGEVEGEGVGKWSALDERQHGLEVVKVSGDR